MSEPWFSELDVLEQLKKVAGGYWDVDSGVTDLCANAADEIERLRAKLVLRDLALNTIRHAALAGED